MGREYRSKLEIIQILWKAKLPPLDWSNGDGPPPGFTTQDEGYEQTEYDEDYPQEAYNQEERQQYEREYRDSDSRAWWLLHHQGLWNLEGSAMGQWSVVYSPIYTC